MTVVVSGPHRAQILIPRGQRITHDGRRTVWTGTVTPEEEVEVAEVLRAIGLDVDVHTVDPDEGLEERAGLHTAPPEGIGRLPTIACPACAWLDHGPDGFRCGAESWHPVAARAFDHGKAADDLRACPVGRTIDRPAPTGR